MIAIRRARASDAPGIAAVHVACWRSAYAGVLPDEFLARLSVARQTSYYDRAVRLGLGVHVAAVSGEDVAGTAPQVVGFSTARRTASGLGDGEVETLYVLDDFKERGIGKTLLRASAKHLAAMGCRSAFAWVLRANPSAFFYDHLGGKRIAAGETQVGGETVPQVAYAWDPIELLLDVDA